MGSGALRPQPGWNPWSPKACVYVMHMRMRECYATRASGNQGRSPWTRLFCPILPPLDTP
ncbi:hypothetical protein WCLP8_4030002 [uncultured Gammaproteobacteria bacterium]